MPDNLKIVEQNPGAKTLVESIPEPVGQFGKDFVKYSLPGVLTKEELEAGAEKLGRLYEYAKQRDYRQVAGTSLQVLGHALMASVGLVPFAGGFKPIVSGITSSERSAVSKSATVAENGLTKVAPKAKVQFTAPELLDQANIRLRRTLTDKEYQGALSKQFPNDADMLLSGQLKEANKSVITPSFPENPLSVMITNSRYVTLGGYKLSFSDWEALVEKAIKKRGLNLSVEQYAKNYLGVSDNLWKTISTSKPEISLSKETYEALKNQNVINQEELRKLFYHEQIHAGGHSSKEHRTYITEYNKQFPVKVKEGVSDCYLDPGEIRARAMSLRRLRQITGKSYEELLNTWNITPHRPDPNVDDLINYYDRESLLNYLNHFLKYGGKINYLDLFRK